MWPVENGGGSLGKKIRNSNRINNDRAPARLALVGTTVPWYLCLYFRCALMHKPCLTPRSCVVRGEELGRRSQNACCESRCVEEMLEGAIDVSVGHR